MASTGGVLIGSSYDEARTRKIAAEAEIAELELAKVKGLLVLADDVVDAWQDVLNALRGKLLSLPTKAAPMLAVETEPPACQEICEQLINEALEELSNYDPLFDPASTKRTDNPSEEGDDKPKAPAKKKSKRVGRPRKATGLANK
jgi:hypothetical protein